MNSGREGWGVGFAFQKAAAPAKAAGDEDLNAADSRSYLRAPRLLALLPPPPGALGKQMGEAALAKLHIGPVHGNLATCAPRRREGGCASFTKRDTIKQNAQ